MTTRRPAALPDITDDDFRRRLDPLARAVVPGSTATEAREPDSPANTRDPKAPALARFTVDDRAGEGRATSPDSRITDDPVYRDEVGRQTGSHAARRPSSSLADRIAAVTQMELVLAARGPKKGVEFLLPERVISALKNAAAQEGTSMTVKVLEALRGAGYPITDADFVDLRKLPKR